MKNKFYNELKKELCVIGIDEKIEDIRLMTNIFLSSFHREDREYLLHNEEKLKQKIVEYYESQKEFDKKIKHSIRKD